MEAETVTEGENTQQIIFVPAVRGRWCVGKTPNKCFLDTLFFHSICVMCTYCRRRELSNSS